MKVRLDIVGCFALLVVWVLIPTEFGLAATQAQTTVQVMPQTAKVRRGQQATVDLLIDQVEGLYGAQVRLTFDPDVIEVVDADPAQDGVQVEPGTIPSPDYVVRNTADNRAGTIDYALTQVTPRDPANGGGVLARVTFRGRTVAVSEVRFDQIVLATNEGGTIAAVPLDGQVRVIGGLTWLYIAAAGIAVLLIVGGGVGFIVKRK